MAKMSFEEWLQARKEYNDYLKGQSEPEIKPEEKREERPVAPAAEPEPAPEAAPAPMGPAEDYRKELNDLREEMRRTLAALSPSLGDVQPVGIEDVVTNFFKQS